MIYIALTIISLSAKIFAFKKMYEIYNASLLHKLVLAFIGILIAQSIFELSLYYYAKAPYLPNAYWSLVGYYFCLFNMLTLLPFVAFTTTNIIINRYFLYSILLIIIGINISLLFTNWIIADVQLLEVTKSLTRVPGKYYLIFQAYTLLSMILALSILGTKSFDDNFFIRIRSINFLVAFIPSCLFATFIVFAMALGVKFNAVGILPFCFLIYVAALVHNLQPDKQPDYLVFLPFSKKNKILMNMLHDLIYTQEGINQKALDNQLINYYLAQPGLTQKDVARMLNMSESTLSRRKRRK